MALKWLDKLYEKALGAEYQFRQENWPKLHGVRRARLRLLICQAIMGIVLCVIIAVGLVCFGVWSGLWGKEILVNVPQTIIPLALFLPVFVALWYVRTEDTRQNIHYSSQQINEARKQADLQLQRDNFIKGIEYVRGDSEFDIKLGVGFLENVSRESNEFDEQIRFVFTETLEKPSRVKREKEITTFEYAAPMLGWLIRYNKKSDFHTPLWELDLSNQAFTNPIPLKINVLFERRRRHPARVNFSNAHCTGIDFAGMVISGCNFVGATSVDLTDAYIVEGKNCDPQGLPKEFKDLRRFADDTGKIKKGVKWDVSDILEV